MLVVKMSWANYKMELVIEVEWGQENNGWTSLSAPPGYGRGTYPDKK